MRNIFNHELKILKDWAVTSLTGRKHAADDIELIEFFYRSDIVFIYFLFFIIYKLKGIFLCYFNVNLLHMIYHHERYRFFNYSSYFSGSIKRVVAKVPRFTRFSHHKIFKFI